MRSFILVIASVLIPFLIMTGCAQTKQNALQPASSINQIAGLPADIVDVRIYDLRPEVLADDGLKEVLRNQVLAVLSENPTAQTTQRYRLSIDIVEHRAFTTPGNCNACTRLKVKLLAAKGTLINEWDVLGSVQRPETSGDVKGEDVSQESYNITVNNLMSTLSQLSVM